MIRMISFTAAVLLGSSAAAEPFSLRCIDHRYEQPYFFTIDLASRRVIVELVSGRWIAGRVNSATADKIEFQLLESRGDVPFDLVWEPARQRVTSLAKPSIEGREFTIESPCALTETRSVFTPPPGRSVLEWPGD